MGQIVDGKYYMWDWADVFSKSNNILSGNLLNYGLSLDLNNIDLSSKFIKAILINSRIKINHSSDIAIIMSLLNSITPIDNFIYYGKVKEKIIILLIKNYDMIKKFYYKNKDYYN